jgi:uncharacterized membrane-anchored protein YitT (DUF2179 family)
MENASREARTIRALHCQMACKHFCLSILNLLLKSLSGSVSLLLGKDALSLAKKSMLINVHTPFKLNLRFW